VVSDPEIPELFEPEDDYADMYEPDDYVDGFEFYDEEATWEL